MLPHRIAALVAVEIVLVVTPMMWPTIPNWLGIAAYASAGSLAVYAIAGYVREVWGDRQIDTHDLLIGDLIVYHDLLPRKIPPIIEHIQLGVEIKNTSEKLVSYIIEEIDSSVAGKVHRPQASASREAIVQPHTAVRCSDYRIEGVHLTCDAPIKADFTLVIRYGTIGRESRILPVKLEAQLYFNSNGTFHSAKVFWNVAFMKSYKYYKREPA